MTLKSLPLLALFALLFSCNPKNNNEPVIRFTTNHGKITVKLYPETPQHRDNFVKLVESGYYDGLLFHRVISEFMIQAGDPDSRNAEQTQSLGSGDTPYTIPAEIIFPRYYHKKGALAAARQGDYTNPQRASSGGQFYIVQGRTFSDEQLDMMQNQTGVSYSAEQRNIYKTLGGTPHLDGQYTVFGEVTEGFDVIEKISRVKTGEMDRPIENVRITKAVRIK